MQKLVLKIMTFIVMFFAISLVTFADDYFWRGSDVSCTTNNWSELDCWDDSSGLTPSTIPAAGDNVFFDVGDVSDSTIDQNFGIANLDMDAKYTGTVSVGASVTLIRFVDMDMGGGTFLGGSADLDMSDDFLLNGTNFTSTSGELRVSDDFDMNSGSFVHNGGTVVLQGSASCNFDEYGGLVLNNFSIQKSTDSANMIMYSGNHVTVEGELELANGIARINNTSSITVNGSLDYQSTFDGADSSSYVGPIYLNMPQTTVTLPDGVQNLPSLTINNKNIVETSGTSPISFFGNLLVNNDGRFNNTANVDIDFKLYVTILTANTGAQINLGSGVDITHRARVYIASGTYTAGTDTSIYIPVSSSNEFVLDGGTMDLSSAMLLDIDSTDSSAFNLESGTFLAPKDMKVAGGFDMDGGSFVHNNGVLTFDGSSNMVFDEYGGLDLATLKIDKSSDTGRVLMYGGNNVTVEDELELSNGILAIYTTGSSISVGTTLDYQSTFDGMYSGYLGPIYLDMVSPTTTVLPDGVENVPSISVRNSNTLETSGSSAISFAGFLELNGASASFDNVSDVDIDFNYFVSITSTGGTIDLGDGVSISHAFEIFIDGGLYTVGNASDILFSSTVYGPVLTGGTVDLTGVSTLTIKDTGTDAFNLSGADFYAPDEMYIDGTFKHTSGSFVHNSGEVVLQSANTSSFYALSAYPLYNLSIEKSSATNEVRLYTDLSIENDFIFESGEFLFYANTLRIGGDFKVNDLSSAVCDFTASTLIFDGTGVQEIGPTDTATGDITLNFYNLTKQASQAGESLLFDAGSTFNILNVLTLQGLNASNLLTLSSYSDPLADWYINPSASRVVEFVDVEYSNNLNALAIDATSSVNSGNNTNWNFGYKYWVGDDVNCNGNWDDTDCWAGSSGGVTGEDLPGATSHVYFDANSGSGSAADCDLNTNVSVAGMWLEEGYEGSVTGDSSYVLNVGAEKFLQRGGNFYLNGMEMINLNELYVYGGDFVSGASDLSMSGLYFDYFVPRSGDMDLSLATTVDINGDFVYGSNTDVASGTFDAPLQMNIEGNVYSYSGNDLSYVHNDGAVYFDGSSSSGAYKYTDIDFYDVYVDKDSSDTFTVEDRMFVLNNLNIVSGELVIADNLDVEGDLINQDSLDYGDGNTIDVNGDFNNSGVVNGGLVNMLNLYGDFLNSSTYNAGTSTVNLDGANQTIYGSTTFYNLTKQTSTPLLLSFEALTTQTITNNLVLEGNTSSSRLSLKSTVDSSQWNIDVDNSYLVSFVDLEDSLNISGFDLSASNSVDSGNNTNWDFGERYWVGSNGANFNDASSWSTESGGTGGAGVPGDMHTAIFDSGANTNCVIDASIDVGKLDFRDSYTASVSVASSAVINADYYEQAGNCNFDLSGQTMVISDDMNISDGSFVSGSGSLTISGDLDLNTVASASGLMDFSSASALTVYDTFNIGANSSTGSFTAPSSTFALRSFDQGSGSTSFIANGGTLEFVGSSASYIDSSYTFYNLVVNKTRSESDVVLMSDLDIDGDFTLTQGVFSAGNSSYDIYLAGDFSSTANSSFSAGNSTLILNGSSQSILGSNTFYNLKKVVSSYDTLVFEAFATQTIEGTMDFRGALGALLTLNSSINTSYWYLDPQGARIVEYLAVKDSTNISASSINAIGTGSVDLGNNTDWLFGAGFDGYVDALFSFAADFMGSFSETSSEIYSKIAPYYNPWTLSSGISGVSRIYSALSYKGQLYLATDNAGGIYKRSDQGFDLRSNTDVVSGQYAYVVVTYDKDAASYNANMYIDGQLDASYDFSNLLDTNDLELLIGTSYGASKGGDNASGEEFFKGEIDELRISDRVLDSAWVETSYNNVNDISSFMSFGDEEIMMSGSGGTGGTVSAPMIATNTNVGVLSAIGGGALSINSEGNLATGVNFSTSTTIYGSVTSWWTWEEAEDKISFRDASPADGFRIVVYMDSGDSGKFVYNGDLCSEYNLNPEVFKIYANYDLDLGQPIVPDKGVDDNLKVLNINSAESCDEALDLDRYTFNPQLETGDYGMDMSANQQVYFSSNVPCVQEGELDMRAMSFTFPKDMPPGTYNSTMYIILVDGGE